MSEDYPIIRKFELKDLEEILRIEKQAFPKTAYSKEVLLHYAFHYSETFVVMETGAGIAGYIIFDKTGHIHSTAVKPTQRKQGLGTMLFRHARKHAEQRAWLEVRSQNTGAIAFYKAMGMKVTGTIPKYYGKDDALVMVQQRGTEKESDQ
jgi:ribosomal-protein-alanine acetyltransferase